jgi:hypothetical protein
MKVALITQATLLFARPEMFMHQQHFRVAIAFVLPFSRPLFGLPTGIIVG